MTKGISCAIVSPFSFPAWHSFPFQIKYHPSWLHPPPCPLYIYIHIQHEPALKMSVHAECPQRTPFQVLCVMETETLGFATLYIKQSNRRIAVCPNAAVLHCYWSLLMESNDTAPTQQSAFFWWHRRQGSNIWPGTWSEIFTEWIQGYISNLKCILFVMEELFAIIRESERLQECKSFNAGNCCKRSF